MLMATTGLSFPETSEVVLPTSVPFNKNFIILDFESRFDFVKESKYAPHLCIFF